MVIRKTGKLPLALWKHIKTGETSLRTIQPGPRRRSVSKARFLAVNVALEAAYRNNREKSYSGHVRPAPRLLQSGGPEITSAPSLPPGPTPEPLATRAALCERNEPINPSRPLATIPQSTERPETFPEHLARLKLWSTLATVDTLPPIGAGPSAAHQNTRKTRSAG